MALLQRGVDLSVIALWLGQESTETTEVYLHADMRLKERALAHATPSGLAPERYRASSAFIVDAAGNRSRQIDIAIYDRFYSPLIFPFDSGFLVPAESVYAVVEVKQLLTRLHVRNAGLKIASVRRLKRTSVPVPFAGGSYPPKKPHRILGVLAATRSVWVKDFQENVTSALAQLGVDFPRPSDADEAALEQARARLGAGSG
jgi:hypothetical protein